MNKNAICFELLRIQKIEFVPNRSEQIEKNVSFSDIRIKSPKVKCFLNNTE